MRKAQQTRSLVAAWFDFLPPDEMPAAQVIHKTIRATVADLTETVGAVEKVDAAPGTRGDEKQLVDE